nr:heterogeneous nuclear ribonucleoprotein A3 homolog 2-like [Arachis hypogaea]
MAEAETDPEPSHAYLEWWHEHERRFLSHELFLEDPRADAIPANAIQRGSGWVSDMDQVPDVPDRCLIERRHHVGTRASEHEWRWLNDAIDAIEGIGQCHRRGRCPDRSGNSGSIDGGGGGDGGSGGGGDGRGEVGFQGGALGLGDGGGFGGDGGFW